MAGDLALHVLLADEVMQADLPSAGHTVATFMRDRHSVTVVHAKRRCRLS